MKKQDSFAARKDNLDIYKAWTNKCLIMLLKNQDSNDYLISKIIADSFSFKWEINLVL